MNYAVFAQNLIEPLKNPCILARIMALFLFLVLSSISLFADPPEIPKGDWRDSCHLIGFASLRLEASCVTKGGGVRQTSIELRGREREEIGNIDGYLAFKPNDDDPKGSWQDNCHVLKNQEKENSQPSKRLIETICESSSNYVVSQVEFSPAEQTELSNKNGYIGLTPNRKHPEGSWRQHCAVLDYSNLVLKAVCSQEKQSKGVISDVTLPGEKFQVSYLSGVLITVPDDRFPLGDWRKNCGILAYGEGKINYQCLQTNGHYRKGDLDYSAYPEIKLKNLNGALAMVPDDHFPLGDWRENCGILAYGEGKINYRCLGENGIYHEGDLDYSAYPEIKLKNLNGALAMVPDCRFPLGDWRKNCGIRGCEEGKINYRCSRLKLGEYRDGNLNYSAYPEIKLKNLDGVLAMVPDDHFPPGDWRKNCGVLAYGEGEINYVCQNQQCFKNWYLKEWLCIMEGYHQGKLNYSAYPGIKLKNLDGTLAMVPDDSFPPGDWREKCHVFYWDGRRMEGQCGRTRFSIEAEGLGELSCCGVFSGAPVLSWANWFKSWFIDNRISKP